MSRRVWTFGAVGVALLAGVLVAAAVHTLCHSQIAAPPLLTSDARNLRQTLVTPHSEAAIRPGKNVLWCSAFQLVWNEMCLHAGGYVHLKDEPAIVLILNQRAAANKDANPSGCLVMSGLIENRIVDKIRWEVNETFQGQADPNLLNGVALPPQGYLAYAYLVKDLPLKYRLNRLKKPLVFGSAKVASFGLENVTAEDDRKAEQITILDYKNDDNFILALQPKDATEQIVFAKIAPSDTLQKSIDAVRSRIDAATLEPWQQHLQANESLAIPILDFEVWKAYEELNGKKITTSGPLEGTPLGRMPANDPFSA